ncbi:MAG: transglycosylase domain-containing protein [Deltaproteobacteria bacterium]|nr:transglycosylase domain-containing protein [Deltaproteobacteria bacterium]
MAAKKKARSRKSSTFLLVLLLITLGGAGCWLLYQELSTSRLQARWLHRYAGRMTFDQKEGPASRALWAPSGPHDLRLGYSSLSVFTRNLIREGFYISSQARVSEEMWNAAQAGVFPPYREKTQAGLRILDRNGMPIFYHPYPSRIFRSFQDIPPLIVEMLLFAENRMLLDEHRPMMNPAVEWHRLVKAVMENAARWIDPDRSASGGSTLATQLEKLRHSNSGITDSVEEKIRQMVSATLRAYRNGENTMEARRQIILDYVNSIPLAAFPGYGEIYGLGDGLWVWYETDFDLMREVISVPERDMYSKKMDEKALLVKQILSLLIAQRRPSDYLLRDREALNHKCNCYLRLMAGHGILSPELRDRCLSQSLPFRNDPPPIDQISLEERKAANPIRTSLLSLLGVDKLYDLDRMDLSVRTTLDLPAQIMLTREILKLQDPHWLAERRLTGSRLLDRGDPHKVIYSLVLYESTEKGNLMRLEIDNYDLALNINEGVKLDMGSTAKLRTIIHYLEIVESLHEKYGRLGPRALGKLEVQPEDRLSRWAIDYVSGSGGQNLREMLSASLERLYSASPREVFFTGGGEHNFENFDSRDDNLTMSVGEGFMNSVNLVFIRLMRDIVRYHIHQDKDTSEMLRSMNHPMRKEYLARFADLEGRVFLEKFYPKYKEKSPEQAFRLLLQSIRPVISRLAIVYRYIYPRRDIVSFGAFLQDQFPDAKFAAVTIQSMYDKCMPQRFTLPDIGFIAHVHPLELWLVACMQKQEKPELSKLIQASEQARQEVYDWLFRTSNKSAQDIRIRMLLEMGVFLDIHRAWQRLGYPFDALVPSYATAIGSSADRPAALAELIGILVNNGYRMPMVRIEQIEAATQTPYEVSFSRCAPHGERVLSPEIAEVTKDLLFDVVKKGTAIRGYRSFERTDGTRIPLGGKTGTGDHRYEVYGKGGELIASRVMNRSATFAFMIGSRFFGTIMAFVPGPEAAQYGFTSSFPIAILKTLAPDLMPLLDSRD